MHPPMQPKEHTVKARHLSPKLAIVIALVMCAPSLRDTMSGALVLDALGLRLLLALGVSYAGITFINHLLAGYAPVEPEQLRIPVAEEEKTAA